MTIFTSSLNPVLFYSFVGFLLVLALKKEKMKRLHSPSDTSDLSRSANVSFSFSLPLYCINLYVSQFLPFFLLVENSIVPSLGSKVLCFSTEICISVQHHCLPTCLLSTGGTVLRRGKGEFHKPVIAVSHSVLDLSAMTDSKETSECHTVLWPVSITFSKVCT